MPLSLSPDNTAYIDSIIKRPTVIAKKHRPTSYELLGQRIQIEIAAASRREKRQVHLKPEDGDSPDDWDRLIDEISENENENVDVTRTDEGWLVSWVPVEV